MVTSIWLLTTSMQKHLRDSYSLRQEFNFLNQCTLRTLLKLFGSTIKPILLYGSEVSAALRWNKNNTHSILRYLITPKHQFWKLTYTNVQKCIRCTQTSHWVDGKIRTRKIYPGTTNIVCNIINYHQHLLTSSKKSIIGLMLKHIIYVGSYHSWKTEQFYKIKKSLTLWHGAKCITAITWLCF